MKKKIYIKPEIREIAIDNNISLIMMTSGPKPKGPRPIAAPAPTGNPLASPFSDRPFN